MTVRNIKANFTSFYKNDILCPLCNKVEDTQQHLLECDIIMMKININTHIKYEHIFGDLDQQVKAAQYIHTILEIRQDLVDQDPSVSSAVGP